MKKLFAAGVVAFALLNATGQAAVTNAPSAGEQTNINSRLLRPLSLAEALDIALQQNSAIRKSAAALQQPGGDQAVQLKVAETAVAALAQLAQKNNPMIVPGNMSEVAGLIGTAMSLITAGGKAQP